MRKLKNEELDRLSLQEFKTAGKIPLVLVLENIRSMNNVGSAFRTADAFLLEKIFLCGITGQPPHREINKTALGATESVAWEYRQNSLNCITELKSKGYRVLLVEQTDRSTPLFDFTPENEKFVLVFGNEISGVSEELLPLADEVLEIPQYGTKHSLNISVSIGIVIWDLISKLKLFTT